MKNLILILLLFVVACRDSDGPVFNPTDATMIEGHCWADLTGTVGPEWCYCFERGLLTQTYYGFGATFSSLSFPYAIRHDTVLIGGDANNPPRTWLLFFECDEVARVTTSAALNHRFWLKRE